MQKTYQILILSFVIIISLLLYTYSVSQSNNEVSQSAWNKYEASFKKLTHLSIMLNQMQHLTRIYLATTINDDEFKLDELIQSASSARSSYIQHYLELEKMPQDATEKQHMQLINQQAGKIRIAQMSYDDMIISGVPLAQRLTLAMDTIITPQNQTQILMQEFINYIRTKTIRESDQYQLKNGYGVHHVKQLQLLTLYLTVFLSIFSVYIVFKRQKTIHDQNIALSQAESFLNSTINSTPIALLITNKSGDIVMANHMAEKLFDYTRAQLLSSNISSLIPEQYRQQHQQYLNAYVKHPVNRDMYSGLEISAQKSSGDIIPVEVGLNPVDGQDELFIACSIKDITHQKAMENAILDSKHKAEQANQAKSEFLANVSHELRTPMHAILSFSRLGLKGLEPYSQDPDMRDKLNKYFKNIQLSGDKLLKFINNLLDSAKFESGKMQLTICQCNIMKTLQASINEQEAILNELELQVNIKQPDTDFIIQCDLERIDQVITNLISNAIKYSPRHGQIQVNITSDFLPTETNETRKIMRFSVQDEGPGIPEAHLHSIFEKFIQSSNSVSGGTGLGLSLCKDIIEAHGGQIWAENHSPQGALFTFIIPVEQTVPSV